MTDYRFEYIKNQMTDEILMEQQKSNNEKIQQLKEDIAVLQEKLQKLEEKSSVEEAFKKVFRHYPNEKDFREGIWFGFEKGYIAAQKDYKVEEPEELKTLYQMFYENDWNVRSCGVFCNIVKKWMSQYADNVMCGEYLKGYKECLTVLEENLKND